MLRAGLYSVLYKICSVANVQRMLRAGPAAVLLELPRRQLLGYRRRTGLGSHRRLGDRVIEYVRD